MNDTQKMLTKGIENPEWAFNHQNPWNKQLIQKKGLNHYYNSISHEEDASYHCRRMKFNQFVQIKYADEVPQFVVDFFKHMTGVNLQDFF